MAIPSSDVTSYKTGGAPNYRRDLNVDETLIGFDQRFARTAPSDVNVGMVSDPSAPLGQRPVGEAGAFRSASEICDMYLVPGSVIGGGGASGPRFTNVGSWWTNYRLTGDNVREYPYGQIYPRVTTRSNTFTVHMRVQTLQKSTTTPSAVWDEERDTIVSEYRGSTMLERYVDSGDPKLPDFADPRQSAATMDTFYRIRTINTKKFAP
jgi:hypothetical protein